MGRSQSRVWVDFLSLLAFIYQRFLELNWDTFTGFVLLKKPWAAIVPPVFLRYCRVSDNSKNEVITQVWRNGKDLFIISQDIINISIFTICNKLRQVALLAANGRFWWNIFTFIMFGSCVTFSLLLLFWTIVPLSLSFSF